jgi:protein phosphatase
MDQAQSDQVKTAAQSDVGRVRSANQDCCGEFSNTDGYRLLVLADGMGGHAGGETASRLALETIGGVFQQPINRFIKPAKRTLHSTAWAPPGSRC